MVGIFKSPVLRISLSLVLLISCILMTSGFLGLIPDTKKSELDSRKVIVEMLATQLVVGGISERIETAKILLKSLVERNEGIHSAAIRVNGDKKIIEYGSHDKHWVKNESGSSTPTHLQVPIYSQSREWGALEVSFSDLGEKEKILSMEPFYSLLIFVAVCSFVSFFLFLKRALLELDPGEAMPERVNKALNTLSEGLVIIDEHGRILFSNDFFVSRTALQNQQLIGKAIGDLDWLYDDENDRVNASIDSFVKKGEISGEMEIYFSPPYGDKILFKVKSSQISGPAGEMRGALVTFSDITELELKNKSLHKTLGKLEKGQQEIKRKNKELQILATRDPLTGCLNRRSFFDGLKSLMSESRGDNTPLSCIMLDIDHFKSVNDNYGHSVGDQVIKIVVKKLVEVSRSSDLIGRYGGEEFCVVLPNTDLNVAMDVAECMRKAIMAAVFQTAEGELRVTTSFGVVANSVEFTDADEFVDKADRALYLAKENGRNRVNSWAEKGGSTVQAKKKVVISKEMPQKNSKPLQGEADTNRLDLPNTAQYDTGLQHILCNQYGVEGGSGRFLLFDRILQSVERSRRYNGKIALLILDLQDVWRINHSMGASVGEKFIKQITKRIRNTLRETDSISIVDIAEIPFSLSQLSSDELAILLTDIKEDELIVHVVRRIFKTLDAVSIVEGHELYINSSIGISLFPDDGEEPDTLISSASAAMREAKRLLGRNNFRFSSADINLRANNRLKIENALHGAVERDEFVVHYQPKVNIKTGSIAGLEALVRWQHPELGLVSPDDFIPLAEQNGLVSDITASVMNTVCRQLCEWRDSGITLVPIAVNISPVEFKNENLSKYIVDIVNQFELSTDYVELEITENVVMDESTDMKLAAKVIQELNQAGIVVSLDDFGTGYCSYHYLKKFPVDKLKIDRCFVTSCTEDACDAAIVNSMITIAKNLGLKAIAEGVETPEQLRLLGDFQCDQAQGYLISRPIDGSQITELLRDTERIRRLVVDCTRDQGGTPHSDLDGCEMVGLLNNLQ
jgi:diguanylate cyclase (GGDEF)-like protein/PAS domain S-box-containing protein